MKLSRPAHDEDRQTPPRRSCWRFVPALAAAGLLASAAPDAARACSVCFGDPESQMAISATRGVLVLLGFIGLVLASIATIGGCWIVRAQRLHAANRDPNSARSLFFSE